MASPETQKTWSWAELAEKEHNGDNPLPNPHHILQRPAAAHSQQWECGGASFHTLKLHEDPHCQG